MKGFYSDTFKLPLPERHRFPMVKYSMLRERVARDGIRGSGELRTPRAVTDEEILRATTRWHRRYLVPANARRRPGGGARRRGCGSRPGRPARPALRDEIRPRRTRADRPRNLQGARDPGHGNDGGYARRVENTVEVHFQSIRRATDLLERSVGEPTEAHHR